MNTDLGFNCRECGSSETWLIAELHVIISLYCPCKGSAFQIKVIDICGFGVNLDGLKSMERVEDTINPLDDKTCAKCLQPYISDNELLHSLTPITITADTFLICDDCDEKNEDILYDEKFLQSLKETAELMIGNPEYAGLINLEFPAILNLIQLLSSFANAKAAMDSLKSVNESLLTPEQLEKRNYAIKEVNERINMLTGGDYKLRN